MDILEICIKETIEYLGIVGVEICERKYKLEESEITKYGYQLVKEKTKFIFSLIKKTVSKFSFF